VWAFFCQGGKNNAPPEEKPPLPFVLGARVVLAVAIMEP